MLFGAGPLKVVSQVFVLKGTVIQGALVAGEKSVGVTLESNSYVLKKCINCLMPMPCTHIHTTCKSVI